MRRIVVSVQNSLLAEALTALIAQSGEFEPFRVPVDKKKQAVPTCAACGADIVIMEVSRSSDINLESRMAEVARLRSLVPGCKVVFLCDENVSPEIAHDVVVAKRNNEIDAFYYSSVTGRYLMAALCAL